MADIEAERAWMRTHGIRQRAENGAESARRDAEAREYTAKTCAYCFHEKHEIDWGGGVLTVLYCQAETGCQCGVPPCAQCGSRIRAAFMEGTTTERCAGCGAEWEVSAIA